MTFVKEENSIYQFIDENNNKYCIGSDSQENALAFLQATLHEGYSIDVMKFRKINTFKTQARLELDKDEWMVNRHKEQLETATPRSLSVEQYNQLLADRQAIRDKSNDLEAQINEATTIEELELINW